MDLVRIMLYYSFNNIINKKIPFIIHYLETENPDISPNVSVGPSALHTESSGVRDASASVTSMSGT